jgi:hypothetical protein
MSSPGFPTLNLDVSARRAERLIATSILVITVAGLSLLQQSLASVAIVVLCAAVSVGFGFRTIGWIGGPRRLARIVCQADGHWLLCDADGRTSEAMLSGASRITPFAMWLAWTGRAGRPLLLLPGDVAASDFRRLVVRLRLSDRLSPAGKNDEP